MMSYNTFAVQTIGTIDLLVKMEKLDSFYLILLLDAIV